MREMSESVALVTGGSQGIGRALCLRLAALGAKVVVADVGEEKGRATAEEIGGVFVRCDVTDPAASVAAVAAAEEAYGGLDLIVLNAGIGTGCGVDEDFDLERYRLAMAVNIDGVVYGVHAALPAFARRGGGAIIATASLAGLVGIPTDPIYGANKHAVVGLVRSLAPSLATKNVTVNAICPGFADTAIVDGFRDQIEAWGVPLLDADDVADAAVRAATEGRTGEAWFVQPGREPQPFLFRNVPGPRPVEA